MATEPPTWRFYAQRIVSGEWLDTDVNLSACSLTYNLSAPNSGQIVLPYPDVEPIGSDNKPVWGKWNTMFYAEKNGNLDSAFIVDSISPGAGGAKVALIGTSGWLQRVDYSGNWQVWERDTFDAVRELIDHANGKPRGLTFVRDNSNSVTTVGDPEPPPKPTKPPRHKGESKADYQASTRYHNWQDDLTDWNNAYGSNERYKLVFWEAPIVGDELNSLANENSFDWREQYTWTAPLTPQFKINFADDLSVVRTDFAIVDGENVVGRLAPSDDDDTYANKVLVIGAGQGQKARKASTAVDDGRLYSAAFHNRKHTKNQKQLQRAANRTVARLRKIDPQIGNVTVRDDELYAPAETLLPGNIVPVRSNLVYPSINTMGLIKSKTVDPMNPGVVQLDLETLAP